MTDKTDAQDPTTEENTNEATPPNDTVPPMKPSEDVLPEDKTEDKTDETAEDTTDDSDKEDAPEFDPAAWSEERNEVADSVFQMLHEGGASPDEAKALLYDAVQSGKVEEIDKDALVEKVGKARANLILAGVKNFISERADRVEAAVTAVHTAAGGEKAWKQVAEWVNKNKPEGLDEYRAMIDAGGRQAELAVQALVKLHNSDPNTKSVGKKEIMGDGPSNKAQEGISQRDYGDRLNLLVKKGKATEEARSELLRLRRLGKQQGL